MQFDANSPILFIMGAIIVSFVIFQSIYMFAKAYRQALAMGVSRQKIFKVVRSCSLLTIIPSIPLLVVMLTLVRALGLALPWVRLSVIGAYAYEAPAAAAVANAMNIPLNALQSEPTAFVTAVWVMSIGILAGPIFIVTSLKKYQSRLDKTINTDKRWGKIIVASLFLGLISAFGGQYISRLPKVLFALMPVSGLVSVFTLISAAIIMLLLQHLSKKSIRLAWLSNFDLALATIIAMLLAIVYTNLLGVQ